MFLFTLLVSSTLAQAPVSSTAVSFAPVPVTITPPSGWKLAGQQDNNAVLIPAVSPQSTIMVHTGIYDSADHLGAAMGAAVKDLKFSQGPRIAGNPEERAIAGRQGFVITFAGTSPDGTEVAVYLFGSLLKDVAVGVMGIAPMTQYEAVKAAADEVMRTAKVGAFTFDAKAAVPFTGRWAKARAQVSGNQNAASGGWSDSSSTYYTFAPNGSYEYSSKSVTSISAGGGSMFSSKDDSDSGRYFVFGNKVLFTSQKNGSRIVTFHMNAQRMQLGDAILVRAQ
ncbi:MAG: hypothetical protein JNL98_40950 [Bryobacterales bacterium]|nr:hypothetical protein [Bryobacterales bacterium]